MTSVGLLANVALQQTGELGMARLRRALIEFARS